MTTYKIATCHNSLTNGEKAHSATNPGLQLGDFYITCQLMILSWRHHLSGRPTTPVTITGHLIICLKIIN